MKQVPVSSFMRPDPLTARPDQLLTELVATFEREGLRSIIVTDDSDSLVGVVSETDLFLKERGVPFSMEKVPTLLGRTITQDEINQLDLGERVKVEEIMTRDVVSVSPDETLEEVTWLMHRRRLSLLPVLSSAGTLVGEVRRIHVLRLIYGAT